MEIDNFFVYSGPGFGIIGNNSLPESGKKCDLSLKLGPNYKATNLDAGQGRLGRSGRLFSNGSRIIFEEYLM